MSIKIKNWQKHQHFKDRRPPWVKLYREILEDPDWHDLSGDDAKLLISLWLVASEDPAMNGNLPDARRLSFRVRMKENQLKQSLTRLSNWLILDDISLLSDGYQLDAPETETETETETENRVREQSQSKRQSLRATKVASPLNLQIWKNYSAAYFAKYGTEPVRNAKVNAQVSQIGQRLGEEAPHVAGWFLQHRNGWYVQKMHSLDCLLSDAEKLRTEWATGRSVTQTTARQVDRTQSNLNACEQAIQILRGEAQ